MDLRIITKNHKADPEIVSLKIDFYVQLPHLGDFDSVGVKFDSN